MSKTYDIIIIGAGAAGMSAALYARRNAKSVLVIESTGIGGQIVDSPKVENIPSLVSISGQEYMSNIYDQITALGAQVEFDEIISLTKENNVFSAVGQYGKYVGKAVIIANGVKHRTTNCPGEEKFIGNGISFCALCDGAFYADGNVAVIGGGNSAIGYALSLSGMCKKVTLLARTTLKGERSMQESIRSINNVTVIEGAKPTSFNGSDSLTGITYEQNGKEYVLNVNAVFLAIGHIPDNARFASLAHLDENGFFCSDENCTTATDGLFVAGDCRAKAVRQLTTAIADGSVASTKACQYLDTQFVDELCR